MNKKSSVKVTIVGEEYTIRSDAAPEHTKAVAKFVDASIRGVLDAGVVVESQKAAILAALQITDELFKALASRRQLAHEVEAMSASVRRMLPPQKRGHREVVNVAAAATEPKELGA